jgi:GT2 family glycosyltransferase
MNDIRCDIILPVCDQFEFTKNCVESIIKNTVVGYRLIVVNNGKNVSTAAYLVELKSRLGNRLEVIKNPENIGWVKALNQGIAVSRAPYLCFQNDDTIVTAGWLNRMIDVLDKNEKIGIVNPSWEGRPANISIDEYGRRLEKKFAGKFIETDWARGFSVVIKREVVEKIGGVDEIYGLAYFDDVDFSVRAINAGFLVALALDTYVYHHRNVTFFEVLKGPRWNELHEKNKLIYYKRWGRPLKIAMVLDGRQFKNRDAVENLKKTVYYIARRQHHIDIFSPRNIGGEIRHTNVSIKRSGPLARLWAGVELYFNSRKKPSKRYAAIFDYARLSGRGSGQYITSMVDALKEKTKEEIGG